MIAIIKSHDEDCVSAHALYKALKINTPPYAKWVENWLPSAKEDHDYFKGDDVKPIRGNSYTEYFLTLEFSKKLCEKRRKKDAVELASFLGEHMRTETHAPTSMVPGIDEADVLVEESVSLLVEPLPLAQNAAIGPQDVAAMVTEEQCAFAKLEEEKNYHLAEAARRTAAMEECQKRLLTRLRMVA